MWNGRAVNRRSNAKTVAAARRSYTTFVMGTDTVSMGFLEALLVRATPAVVPPLPALSRWCSRV